MRQTKREHSWGKLSCKAITLRTDIGHLANAGAASQWIAACPGKSSKPLPVGSLPKQSDQKTYPGKLCHPLTAECFLCLLSSTNVLMRKFAYRCNIISLVQEKKVSKN